MAMRWILASAMMLVSGSYLYRNYQDRKEALAAAPQAAPAPAVVAEPAPMLDAKQLAALRAAVKSGDSNVRWAAMQSLFTFGDPAILPILEQAMGSETDSQIRIGIVLLLKTSGDAAALRILKMGVNDTDPVVRVASLRVIGEVADLAAAPLAAEAVNDNDDTVKLEAITALSRLQQRRKAQYEQLSEQLRQQYESQAKKAQESAG
jgi:HEAT repeat protein